MNKSEIKDFIKKLVRNNKELNNFCVRDKGVFRFETVNSFGLKILELAEDEDVIEFTNLIVKRKNYFGQKMTFTDAIRFNDIEEIDLCILRKSEFEEHQFKMNNDKGYAMANSDWSLD